MRLGLSACDGLDDLIALELFESRLNLGVALEVRLRRGLARNGGGRVA